MRPSRSGSLPAFGPVAPAGVPGRGASRGPLGLAVLLVLPAAAGCAGLLGGPGVGPDGLARRDHDLRGLLSAGRYEVAFERIAERRGWPDDALLRLEYEGLLAHHAGRYGRSNAALQAAADLAEKRYTRSLTRSALSLVLNDRIMAYRPPPVERLLFHHYGILNHLGMGDPEGTGVEARRLVHLLDVYADRGDLDGAAGRRLHATLRYVAGAAFEAIGEENDAAVAYRVARRLDGEGRLPRGPDPWQAADAFTAAARLTGPPGPVTLAASMPPGTPPVTAADGAEAWGDVLVIVEGGFAAHRVERASTLLVRPHEVDVLRAFGIPRLEERRATDEAPALALARHLADGVLEAPGQPRAGAGSGGGRGGDLPGLGPAAPAVGGLPRSGGGSGDGASGTRTGGRDPVILDPVLGPASPRPLGSRERASTARLFRIAWPTYGPASTGVFPRLGSARVLARAAGAASASATRAPRLTASGPSAGVGRRVAGSAVEAGTAAGSAPLRWAGDVSGALVEEYRRREPAIVARAILRAVAKQAVVRALEEELEEEDETLGEIAGVALSAAAALTERADTRGWSLAPAEIGLVRLRLPAGTRRIELQLDGAVEDVRLDLGEARVRPGRLTVLAARMPG